MTRTTLRTLTIVLASLASLPLVAQQVNDLGGSQPYAPPKAAPAKPDSTAKKPDSSSAKKDSMPKPEFKPSWNFSTWIFGAYNMQTDSVTKAANSGQAFSKFTVDRAYLTFRGQVAPDWGFRVTTDVVQLGAGSGYNGLTLRLKYAWMEWDYLHAQDPMDWSAWARIGQVTTIEIDDEERFWPRWIQKTPLEYWAIQPASSDLGAGTQVNFANRWGNAYFLLSNGGGYTVATDADRFKDASLRLSLWPLGRSDGMFKNLELNGWYDAGRTQSAVVINNIRAGLTNNSYGVFLGNADPRFTFGIDWANRTAQTINPADSTRHSNSMDLFSGYIVVRPFIFNDSKGLPLGVILRYDNFKPYGDAYFPPVGLSTSTKQNLFIATLFLDVAHQSSLGISYQGQTQSDPSGAVYEKTMWQFNYQVTF